MWQWQNSSQASDSGPGSSSSSAGPPPGPSGPGGPTQPQELTDMLQMLQDQSGTASFEELNMFNTSFEWSASELPRPPARIIRHISRETREPISARPLFAWIFIIFTLQQRRRRWWNSLLIEMRKPTHSRPRCFLVFSRSLFCFYWSAPFCRSWDKEFYFISVL